MSKWNFYTAKEIKPESWLKSQLEIQTKGLSGNLHKICPDVRDSAWVGGNREGWERVPYWLDGLQDIEKTVLDKSTPLYVHCRSGARSTQATSNLKSNCYTNAHDIGWILSYKGE